MTAMCLRHRESVWDEDPNLYSSRANRAHNTLGLPQFLFEVLVRFGPGDSRGLLAVAGLQYYRAYKEVASPRTDAPENTDTSEGTTQHTE